MKTHPLDNPIWSALTTSHARFAQVHGRAARFLPEISVLAGFEGPLREGLQSLAQVAGPGEAVGLFLGEPAEPVPGWTLANQVPLLQMIHRGGAIASGGCQWAELGEADVPEMLALARLTMPGPFAARTRELGFYAGVRSGGRLAAMAGERLRVPGHAEISAVCTHPDHLGRGYARALMAAIAERQRAGGETPFLHVRQGNARALELYARLGFENRALFHYAFYRREA